MVKTEGEQSKKTLKENVGKIASTAIGKSKDIATKTKDSVVSVVDVNNNGEIDIEDIIIVGLKTPGIRINRADFLRREFKKNHPLEVVDLAIEHNPAYAKISKSEIDKIAEEVIKFESAKVNVFIWFS